MFQTLKNIIKRGLIVQGFIDQDPIWEFRNLNPHLKDLSEKEIILINNFDEKISNISNDIDTLAVLRYKKVLSEDEEIKLSILKSKIISLFN